MARFRETSGALGITSSLQGNWNPLDVASIQSLGSWAAKKAPQFASDASWCSGFVLEPTQRSVSRSPRSAIARGVVGLGFLVVAIVWSALLHAQDGVEVYVADRVALPSGTASYSLQVEYSVSERSGLGPTAYQFSSVRVVVIKTSPMELGVVHRRVLLDRPDGEPYVFRTISSCPYWQSGFQIVGSPGLPTGRFILKGDSIIAIVSLRGRIEAYELTPRDELVSPPLFFLRRELETLVKTTFDPSDVYWCSAVLSIAERLDMVKPAEDLRRDSVITTASLYRRWQAAMKSNIDK